MKKKSMILIGAILAMPAALWLAGYVFAYGPGFDKPGVPSGWKVKGPSAKGTILYKVNVAAQTATLEFHGQCTVGKGSNSVTHTIDTATTDVSFITDENAFLTATAQDIAQSVENYFTTSSSFVVPLQPCWPNAAGVYVQAVNGSGAKDNTGTEWMSESTLQGVFP